MPSGKVHYKYYRECWPVPVIGAVTLLVLGEWIIAIGVLLGYFVLGRYLDPDLDHGGMTTTEYRMKRELKIFGYLLVSYWQLYSLIPHRHFLSHFPFLSTIIRLFYQFVWIIFLWDIWDNVDKTPIILFGLGVWLGLGIADLIHWYLDNHYDITWEMK